MEEEDFISKTQRKRRMAELQDVGAALVKLSPEQLARLGLPENLLEAVLACKRFNKHEAVRRQMQYIGRIMRDIDAAPIVEKLAELEAPSRRQSALFHVAEEWRQRILEDDAAVERFAREFPAADVQRLRNLAGAAREERGAARAPKHFRELFHAINTTVQEQASKP